MHAVNQLAWTFPIRTWTPGRTVFVARTIRLAIRILSQTLRVTQGIVDTLKLAVLVPVDALALARSLGRAALLGALVAAGDEVEEPADGRGPDVGRQGDY